MKKNIFKYSQNYFIFLILILSIASINSNSNITLLKIGIKNKLIEIKENEPIYKINTYYLNLNISINNFHNIENLKIFSQNIPELSSIGNNSNSNNSFYYCKL